MKLNNENTRFSSYENFKISSESKENPQSMPYISFFLPPSPNEGDAIDDILSSDIKLIKEANLGKIILKPEPFRKFLKTTWMRDNFLYFNGVYFPWRFIDAKGQNRAEREAFVIGEMGIKDVPIDAIKKRMFTDSQEAILAIGEGGLYFPDHENKNLFISEEIICEDGIKGKEAVYEKIKEFHYKIFGDDIQITILPSPDNTNHIDTHLSIIPGTKKALIENAYYEKLKTLGKLEIFSKLGYETIQIPKTQINCPLNILYLKNESKKCAFLFPHTPDLVKNMLKEHGIEIYETSETLEQILDINMGGIRCITNETHTMDKNFLSKLGLQITP